MAKLIIKFNNEVVDHIELKQGDMKIGRKPGCEVFIDNLAISGEHANIFTVGDDSFIQDLGSTNGTFINNKKIAKHHLKNGDAIVIGKHTIVFITESTRQKTAQQSDDFAKTVIISAREPAGPAITVETSSIKDNSAPKTERSGAIFILSGVNSGKRIELTKKVTNLGKVGKRAGAINLVNDGYMLVPGEDETPKLNGKMIAKEGAKLKNGDVIEVASTRLQFYLK